MNKFSSTPLGSSGWSMIRLTWDILKEKKSKKHIVTLAYIGETQENYPPNGQNHHFKHHLQLKSQEDVEGNGLGLQRWRRLLTEKSVFGMSCLVCRVFWVQSGLWSPHLAVLFCKYLCSWLYFYNRSFVCILCCSCSVQSLSCVRLFANPCWGGGKRKTVSLQFLEKNQPKWILRPKWHVGVATFAPLHSLSFGLSSSVRCS